MLVGAIHCPPLIVTQNYSFSKIWILTIHRNGCFGFLFATGIEAYTFIFSSIVSSHLSNLKTNHISFLEEVLVSVFMKEQILKLSEIDNDAPFDVKYYVADNDGWNCLNIYHWHWTRACKTCSSCISILR